LYLTDKDTTQEVDMPTDLNVVVFRHKDSSIISDIKVIFWKVVAGRVKLWSWYYICARVEGSCYIVVEILSELVILQNINSLLPN